MRPDVLDVPLSKGASGAPPLPDALALLGAPPVLAAGDILALMVVRDEALRLPCALRHLWRLGVDRVLLVDNRSTDGTRDIAAQDSRVHLVDAPGSYRDSSYGIDWANALLDRSAKGHWVLVADADELLVFPGSERPGALRALCRHLDAIGSEALLTFLLDCFPAEPLREVRFRSGDDLFAAAPWFEPPALRRERSWRVPALRASERVARAFAPKRSPNLTKAPLVRWREGAGLVCSTHMLRPMALAHERPSGVLLHFKFLQDFHARARDAVARNAHFDGSREYRRYLEALKRDPAFRLHSERSVRYAGPDQLVALGLMRDTPLWAEARCAAAPATRDPRSQPLVAGPVPWLPGQESPRGAPASVPGRLAGGSGFIGGQPA